MRFRYLSLLLFLTWSTVANAQLIKVWYQDVDSDGYGNAAVTSTYAQDGYVKNNIDCDDALPNNTAWGKLGNTGFAAYNTAWSDFAVGGQGTAFFAYSDPNHQTKVSVMKKAAGDSVWTELGTAGFSGVGISYCKIAADSKDTAWVITLESGTAKVYKYNGSAWTQVGANISGGASWPDITIGANDTPYVAFVNSRQPKARKLNKGTNSWVTVGGGNIIGSNVDPLFLKIAMGANGFPFAVYQKLSDGQLYAYQLRGSTWTSLGKGSLGTSTSTKADSLEMAVDTSGNLYVLYKDWNASRKATVRKYNGSAWSTVGTAGFSSAGISRGGIAVNDQTNEVYVAYADSGNTNKSVVVRKYNGAGYWAAVADSTISAGRSYTVCLRMANGVPYVVYKDAANGGLSTAKRFGPDRIWTGDLSSDWNTCANWCGYDAPDTGEAVTFDTAATRQPSTPVITLKSMTVQSTDSITISNTIKITGDLTVNGKTGGTGSISLTGTAAQSISGKGTINNIEINNTAGVTITNHDSIKVSGVLTPTAGTLTIDTANGGALILTSADTLNGASIAAPPSGNAGYIVGKVIAQRYTKGLRAYRYVSHPFTTTISLNAVIDDIDITGPGGTTKGFTWSGTNSPSAYYYDTSGTGCTNCTDPGWKYFPSVDTLIWKRYQAIKLFFRGVKGEGLTGAAYIPSSVIFDFRGEINQGTQTVPIYKGSNSNPTYNLVGNPFPSAIDLENITVPSDSIGDVVYFWSVDIGTKGGYYSQSLATASNIIVPPYSGFFISTRANRTLTFPESCKTTGMPLTVFKTTAKPKKTMAEFQVTDSAGINWDNFMMIMDSNGTDKFEFNDGRKTYNPEVSLYSFSAEDSILAVDRRPYADKKVIRMGLYSPYRKNFILNVKNLNMPEGTTLYIDDKYTNTSTALTQGMKYNFTVNTDTASTGNYRFALRFSGIPVKDTTNNNDTSNNDTTTAIAHNTINTANNLQLSVAPNPATDITTLHISNDFAAPVYIRVFSVTGQQVFSYDAGNVKNTGIDIPVKQWPAGSYIIEATGGSSKALTKLIKQ